MWRIGHGFLRTIITVNQGSLSEQNQFLIYIQYLKKVIKDRKLKQNVPHVVISGDVEFESLYKEFDKNIHKINDELIIKYDVAI